MSNAGCIDFVDSHREVSEAIERTWNPKSVISHHDNWVGGFRISDFEIFTGPPDGESKIDKENITRSPGRYLRHLRAKMWRRGRFGFSEFRARGRQTPRDLR